MFLCDQNPALRAIVVFTSMIMMISCSVAIVNVICSIRILLLFLKRCANDVSCLSCLFCSEGD